MHKVARKQLGSIQGGSSRDDIAEHMISNAIPQIIEIGALPEDDNMEAKQIVMDRMAKSNPMKASLLSLQSIEGDDNSPVRRRRTVPKQEASWMSRMIKNRMPVLTWLPEVRFSSLRSDFVAGLTVGVMVIPQSMSYASIAGLQYIYGMYSACVPTLVYGFFGQSRHLAVGPVALVSLLVSAGLQDKLAEEDCPGWHTGDPEHQSEVCPQEYAELAMLCALVIGVMQILASLCKLGFIVNFLGHPVTSGFTSGAAIIIGLSQVKYMLGYDVEKSQFAHTTVFNLIMGLGETNVATLVLGLASFAFLVINKQLARKHKQKIGMLGPLGPLICCGVGTLLLFVAPFLRDELHVKYVGDIPSGAIPMSFHHWNFKYVNVVFPTSITACLIGYMESIAIGKNLAATHGYNVEAGQELFALGIANVVGGAFSCYPVTGSFSRSAVNNDTGAKSQLSGIITAIVMWLTLMFLTPLFYYLPKFVLAAIVINSVIPLVAYNEARKLWKVKRHDCFLWVVAFVGTLFLGVLYGIALAVLLSLIIVISESVRPQVSILWMIQEGSGEFYRPMKMEDGLFVKNVLIVRIGSSMYFANASFIKDVLLHYVSDMEEINPTEYIILEMTPVVSLDSSALHVIHDIVAEFRKRSINVAFAMATFRVDKTMEKAGLKKFIGSKWFHPTVQAAVQHCMLHKEAVSRLTGRAREEADSFSRSISPGTAEGDQSKVVVDSREYAAWSTVCILTSTKQKSTITSDISAVMARHNVFIARAKIEAEPVSGGTRQTYLVQDAATKHKLTDPQEKLLMNDLLALVADDPVPVAVAAAAVPSAQSHARTDQLRELEVALEQEVGRKRYLEDVLRKNHDLVDSLLQGDSGLPADVAGSAPGKNVAQQIETGAPKKGEILTPHPDSPLPDEEMQAKVVGRRLLDPPLKPPPPPAPILTEEAGGLERSMSSWAHGLDDADQMLAEMRQRLKASAASLTSAVSRNNAFTDSKLTRYAPAKDSSELENVGCGMTAMAAPPLTALPDRNAAIETENLLDDFAGADDGDEEYEEGDEEVDFEPDVPDETM